MNQRPRSLSKNALRRLHCDQQGQSTLEWALLLAAIALPGYAIIRVALHVLVGYYGLTLTINGLPVP